MKTTPKTALSAVVAVLSLMAIVITQNAVAANVEASQKLGGDPLVGAVLMGNVLILACVFFAAVVVLFTTTAQGAVERREAKKLSSRRVVKRGVEPYGSAPAF